MHLLALDLATHLGWAGGDTDDGEPVSGHYKLPVTGDDVGKFLMAYDQWLRPHLDPKPDLVVFEAPMPTQAGRSTQTTILKLYGLCSHTELICAYRKIPCRQVPAAAWKKGFTGTGRISKSMVPYPVTVACHDRGWTKVTNDNEADALGLWTYSVRFASPGREARFDPLARAAFQQAV